MADDLLELHEAEAESNAASNGLRLKRKIAKEKVWLLTSLFMM